MKAVGAILRWSGAEVMAVYSALNFKPISLRLIVLASPLDWECHDKLFTVRFRNRRAENIQSAPPHKHDVCRRAA